MNETCPYCKAEEDAVIRGYGLRVMWTCGTSRRNTSGIVEQSTACKDRQIAALLMIVGRLPKTADGVPVVPGMRVWTAPECEDDGDAMEHDVTGLINFNACHWCDGDGQEAFISSWDDCHQDCDRARDTHKCYSTREAAEQAKEGQGEALATCPQCGADGPAMTTRQFYRHTGGGVIHIIDGSACYDRRLATLLTKFAARDTATEALVEAIEHGQACINTIRAALALAAKQKEA